MARAPRSFFTLPAQRLAPRLIGCTLVRVLEDGTRLAGRIVEVEAYAGIRDTASHAFGGRRTPKNEAMYARPGTAYVYFTYGMHFCMNIVCGGVDEPLAVLLRALEPVEGLGAMHSARARPGSSKPLQARDLCSGPGKLCQALRIDRALNSADLVTSPILSLELPKAPTPSRALRRTPRIGIGIGHAWAEKPLRWALAGSPHLSVPLARAETPRARGK